MSIEKRRVQGSQWKIKELPALVIEGDVHSLVVVQINADNPFSDFTTRVPEQWTLESAGKSLDLRLKNHMMRFITIKGALAPVEGPQQQYRSRSVGPKDRYFLSWAGSPFVVNETSLNLILARWNLGIEEANNSVSVEDFQMTTHCC